jgi:D-galacturonate reductase
VLLRTPQNLDDNSSGTAVYTSSWAAPKSDVHSQQRFFYMGQKGEITVDQAHRGYTVSSDAEGFKSVNPLFMKYTSTNGYFSGQTGYGYRRYLIAYICTQKHILTHIHMIVCTVWY